jgi:spore germination cell wall hydrolase CwlJ-like protein
MSDINYVDVQIGCMAYAIYAEANTQSLEAKHGVGYLILNRVKSKRYGKDICDVVYSKGQFIGISDMLKHKYREPNIEDLLKTKLIALDVFYGKVVNPVARSLYFHDDSIDMKHLWGRKTVKIDNLVFY